MNVCVYPLSEREETNAVKFISAKAFTGTSAWQALPIANMNGITTRLHRTDQPYKWHINYGEEVFVVLDGAVDMHYQENSVEKIVRMDVEDIFYASVGTEHVAHPSNEARVLVIESEGSV
jgi:mannose-6-phosphate isomerase-like protein (cupin superfamily)